MSKTIDCHALHKNVMFAMIKNEKQMDCHAKSNDFLKKLRIACFARNDSNISHTESICHTERKRSIQKAMKILQQIQNLRITQFCNIM